MTAGTYVSFTRVPGHPQRLLTALGGTFLGVALVLLVGSIISDDSPEHGNSNGLTDTAQRAELVAYEKAIEPLIERGGQLVALGLRPGVSDISQASFDRQTLIRMSRSWERQAVRLRAEFAAIAVPVFLEDVARLMDRSVATYVRTAATLKAAAQAEGAERDRHLQRVSSLGPRADRLYDAAMEALDAHRQRLGLTPASRQ